MEDVIRDWEQQLGISEIQNNVLDNVDEVENDMKEYM